MTTTSEYAMSAAAALHQALRISPGDFDAERAAAVIEQAITNATRERQTRARRQLKAVEAAAQERLARLLSSSPAVIYSFKATGDFAPTFVSDNIIGVFGYAPAEYLEDPSFWRDRVHPDDLARVDDAISAFFQNGVHAVEYRFRRKDGSYCWVNDEQRLIRGVSGKPFEIVGSWSDITARKAAEEAKAAAHRRLSQLLTSSPAVIYSYKATGDFAPTFVSENIRDWLGYEPREYLEDADFWRRCVHPDHLAAVEAESVHLFKKGRHTVEYRFLKKDGSFCWVNDAQQLIRDEEGQPAEVVGSWSDITERKRAEEAAVAARDRVEHLLARSPAVIYSFKASGDYEPTFISQNVKELLGYDRAEYLESPDFWRDRVHPEDLPRIEKDYARLFEDGRLANEYRFRKKDGSYCWISDDLQLLRDAAGEPVEIIGAWNDITARKQIGEALVAAQDRLVRVLSSAPAVIYSYKATGDFAPNIVSENIKGLLGYEPREYLENADFWRERVHPDDLAAVEAEFGSPVQERPPRSRVPISHEGRHLLLGERRAAIDPRQRRPAHRSRRLVEQRNRAQRGGECLPAQRAAPDGCDRVDLGRVFIVRCGGPAESSATAPTASFSIRESARRRRAPRTKCSSAGRQNKALSRTRKEGSTSGSSSGWRSTGNRASPTSSAAATVGFKSTSAKPQRAGQSLSTPTSRKSNGPKKRSARPVARRSWPTSS